MRALLIAVFIILVISAGWVNYLEARKTADLSEEDYIEVKLNELGFPPYTAGGYASRPVAGGVYLPVKNFYENQTVNPFGVYRTGRFVGYHSGTDVEVNPEDLARKVPVYSIFEGEVKAVKSANGYGGVVAVEHPFQPEALTAIYGHLRLWDINVEADQKIPAGYLIGYLGADASAETDGERKHLHFGLSRKKEVDIRGYVDGLKELNQDWLDPNEFLKNVGARPVE